MLCMMLENIEICEILRVHRSMKKPSLIGELETNFSAKPQLKTSYCINQSGVLKTLDTSLELRKNLTLFFIK